MAASYTIYRRISYGADDGWWDEYHQALYLLSDPKDPSGNFMYVGDDWSPGEGEYRHQCCCLRWRDVNVPQGSLIRSAYLKLKVDNDAGDDDTIYVTIVGLQEANCPAFSTYADIKSRKQTSADDSWTVGDVDGDWVSIDVTRVIHGIVDQPDYASEALGILLLDANPPHIKDAGKRIYQYEKESQEAPALLVITYEVDLGAHDPVKFVATPTYQALLDEAALSNVVEIQVAEDWGKIPTITIVTEDSVSSDNINDLIDADLGYIALRDAFYGYVDAVDQQNPQRPAEYTIEGRGRLKLALETWLVPTAIDDASPYEYKSKRAEYIVRKLLAVAGITTMLDIADPDFTFGTQTEVEFTLEAVWSAIEAICTILQYDLYQTPDGYVHFTKLDPLPADEPTIPVTLQEGTSGNLTSWTYEQNDEDLIRRCVVFGKGGIKAEVSRWSPHVPEEFPDDMYTAIISSELIESAAQAEDTAADFVERWNRLTRKVSFNAVGNSRCHAGDTVALTAGDFIDEPAFVFSVTHTQSRRGYTMEGELRLKHIWSGTQFTGTVTAAYSGTTTDKGETKSKLHDDAAGWRDAIWEQEGTWKVHITSGTHAGSVRTITENSDRTLNVDTAFLDYIEEGVTFEIWPADDNPRFCDSGAIWEDNWCDGGTMTITSGHGAGQSKEITDTKGAQGGRAPMLVLYSRLIPPPDSGSHYSITNSMED